MNRLTYNTIISKEDLLTRYQYKNAYEMPKLDKIIISLSLKQSRFDRRQLPKLLLASTLITNQKAKTILTKKGDASLGIRKNDPVGTKVTLTPISFASSFITSMSKPSYLLVAGSFIVIGSQSPVVPTFNSPVDKILFNFDSALTENGNNSSKVINISFFIISD